MFGYIKEEIKTVQQRDPAAKGYLEILFCYPGLHAILIHRVANWLWRHKFFFLGRFLSHIGRFLTGIEIHPGATIGRRVFIDHGMGVVIGETAEVHDDVTLYHGVTLGGVSLKKEKRHPTVEKGSIIGAGAKVLGPFTVREGAKIGSNSVVVKEVPAGNTVVGIPGRVVGASKKKESDALQDTNLNFDHDNLPDPVANAIKCLVDRVVEMEKEINILREQIKENESND